MTTLQLKGGTTAQVAAQTPAAREIVVDTTLKRILIGDGSTAGGSPLTVASAPQLTTARTFLVNLASNTAASFNGTANNTPGVNGVLSVANGGTGQSDVSFVRAEDATAATLAISTFVKLAPAEVTDTKSAYDPATGNWVCPADGYYHVIGSVRFGNPATATCTRMIKLDSSTAPSASAVVGQTSLVSAGSGDTYLQVSTLISLAAGATLSLYAYHTDTAAMSALQKSLQIMRIR